MPVVGLTALVIPFGLIVTRVSALILTLPYLASEVAPLRTRVALAVVIAGVLTASTPVVAEPSSITLALLGEFLVGGFIGLVIRTTLAAADFAGEIAGMQMGFGFNRLVNPVMGEQSGSLTRVISTVTGLMVFVGGGHHDILRGLAGSLKRLPPGTALFELAWTDALIERGNGLFVSALRIATPLIIAVLASHLSFGLLTRVAPQLNLWAIGFLVGISVGLGSLVLFAPSLVGELQRLLSDGLVEGMSTVTR